MTATVADEIEAAIVEERHPRFLRLRHEHSNRVSEREPREPRAIPVRQPARSDSRRGSQQVQESSALPSAESERSAGFGDRRVRPSRQCQWSPTSTPTSLLLPGWNARPANPQESEDKPNSDVRMRDQSDNAFMAHRPQQRRGRRRPGGPPGEPENAASAVVHPRRPRSRVPTDITPRAA